MNTIHTLPFIEYARVGSCEFPILHKTLTHVIVSADYSVMDDMRAANGEAITQADIDGGFLVRVPVKSVSAWLTEQDIERIEMGRAADAEIYP